MQVMVWFYKHVDTLGRLMRKVTEQRMEEGLDDKEEEMVMKPFNILCSTKKSSIENRICVKKSHRMSEWGILESINPLKSVQNVSWKSICLHDNWTKKEGELWKHSSFWGLWTYLIELLYDPTK